MPDLIQSSSSTAWTSVDLVADFEYQILDQAPADFEVPRHTAISSGASVWMRVEKVQDFENELLPDGAVLSPTHNVRAADINVWATRLELEESFDYTLWKAVAPEKPAQELVYSIKPEVNIPPLAFKSHIWTSAPDGLLPFQYNLWDVRHYDVPFEYQLSSEVYQPPFYFQNNIKQTSDELVQAFQYNALETSDLDADFEYQIVPELPFETYFESDIYTDTAEGADQDLVYDIVATVELTAEFEANVGPHIEDSPGLAFEYNLWDSHPGLDLASDYHLFRRRVDGTDIYFQRDIADEVQLGADFYFQYGILYTIPHLFKRFDRTFASGTHTIWQSVDNSPEPSFVYQVGQSRVERALSFRYAIDPASIVYAPTSLNKSVSYQILLDGADVTDRVKTCSLSYSINSFVGTVDIAWADKDLYDYVEITSLSMFGQFRIEVIIDGVSQGRFLIEKRNTGVTYKKTDLSSWGRTAPALLGDPYAIPYSNVWDQEITAAAVAHAVAYRDIPNLLDGVAVSWEVHNYKIREGNLEVSNALPISIIRTLADAVGAVLTTDRLGRLRVVYRYGEQ